MFPQVHLLDGLQILGHEKVYPKEPKGAGRKLSFKPELSETTTFSIRVPKVKKQKLINYVAVNLQSSSSIAHKAFHSAEIRLQILSQIILLYSSIQLLYLSPTGGRYSFHFTRLHSLRFAPSVQPRSVPFIPAAYTIFAATISRTSIHCHFTFTTLSLRSLTSFRFAPLRFVHFVRFRSVHARASQSQRTKATSRINKYDLIVLVVFYFL